MLDNIPLLNNEINIDEINIDEINIDEINISSLLLNKIKNKVENLSEEKKSEIKLLIKVDVLKWIYGDTSFLESKNYIIGYKKEKNLIETDKIYKYGKKKGQKKNKTIEIENKNSPIYKFNIGEITEQNRKNEAKWNMKLMKEIRPDLFKKTHSQSSLFGPFGEQLVKEFYILINEYKTNKPEIKNRHNLDLETIYKMVEVKTGSYFTTGTAGEKIYGVPWKYADVPRLYGKPLLIVLLGQEKKESKLVSISDVPEHEEQKKYWKSKNIFFTTFQNLLNSL